MTKEAISRFKILELSEMEPSVREKIIEVEEKAGFIPNIFLTLAHRPGEFHAFFDYHDALMEKEGGLTIAEREMIVVTTSTLNGCDYCVIAHGAILRIRAKDPYIADHVAINHKRAPITDRQKAILDYAVKVAFDGRNITDADHELLKSHGLNMDDIWDIGAISAFFGMSNRLVNMTGTPVNDEFYNMGRDIPPQK